MTTTNTIWDQPADRTKEPGITENFYIVFTADKVSRLLSLNSRGVDRLGNNGAGWPLYGTWVTLIENYSSFSSVAGILSATGSEGVRPLWAQHAGALDSTTAVKSWI